MASFQTFTVLLTFSSFFSKKKNFKVSFGKPFSGMLYPKPRLKMKEILSADIELK
jgi:hypothetical protein